MDWRESMKKMTEISSGVGRRLHNFNFPGNLKWGNRRQFRCVKSEVDDDDDDDIERIPADYRRRRNSGCFGYSRREVDFVGSDSSSLKKRISKERLIYDPSFVDSDLRRRQLVGGFDVKDGRKFKPSKQNGGGFGDGRDEVNGIAAVREKIISDIRIAADKLIWKETPAEVAVEEVEEDEGWRYFHSKSSSPEKPDALECAAGEAKRVAAAAAKVSEFDDENNNNRKNHQIKLRNGGGGGGATMDKEEVVKFNATVSKSEMEEDFIALIGRRPPRKPKKRPRSVQNSVDFLNPGVWLTEVKARRRYEVCHNRSKF